jgi:hypothetical protein
MPERVGTVRGEVSPEDESRIVGFIKGLGLRVAFQSPEAYRETVHRGFVPAPPLGISARSQQLARFAIGVGSLIDARPQIATDTEFPPGPLAQEFVVAFIDRLEGQVLAAA